MSKVFRKLAADAIEMAATGPVLDTSCEQHEEFVRLRSAVLASRAWPTGRRRQIQDAIISDDPDHVQDVVRELAQVDLRSLSEHAMARRVCIIEAMRLALDQQQGFLPASMWLAADDLRQSAPWPLLAWNLLFVGPVAFNDGTPCDAASISERVASVADDTERVHGGWLAVAWAESRGLLDPMREAGRDKARLAQRYPEIADVILGKMGRRA